MIVWKNYSSQFYHQSKNWRFQSCSWLLYWKILDLFHWWGLQISGAAKNAKTIYSLLILKPICFGSHWLGFFHQDFHRHLFYTNWVSLWKTFVTFELLQWKILQCNCAFSYFPSEEIKKKNIRFRSRSFFLFLILPMKCKSVCRNVDVLHITCVGCYHGWECRGIGFELFCWSLLLQISRYSLRYSNSLDQKTFRKK